MLPLKNLNHFLNVPLTKGNTTSPYTLTLVCLLFLILVNISNIHHTQQLIIISVVIQKEFLLCISRGSKNFKLGPDELHVS